MRRLKIGCALLIGFASCVMPASESQLRTRAAFDMSCTEPQVQIVKLDSRTRGVSGCGRKATYVETCDQSSCTWVQNTDTQPSRQ
jgi:hypothetical protein